MWSPSLPAPQTRACLLKAAWGKAGAFKPSYPSIHAAGAENNAFSQPSASPGGCGLGARGEQQGNPLPGCGFRSCAAGCQLGFWYKCCNLFFFFLFCLRALASAVVLGFFLTGQVSYFRKKKKTRLENENQVNDKASKKEVNSSNPALIL